MFKKLYDVAIKVGEFTSKDGQKSKYENIGEVVQGQHGPFMKMKACYLSMQLNHIANKDQSDSVFISMFEPREKSTPQKEFNKSSPTEDFSDDIPI